MSDKLSVIPDSRIWYKNGLQFNCTECGKCCQGFPGYVWLSKEETEAIASYLNLDIQDFIQQYTTKESKGISLKELENDNYKCIFLKGNHCSIYPHRPKQCRTFPWWPQNLQSRENWEKLHSYCEGINSPEGQLFSCENIQDHLKNSS